MCVPNSLPIPLSFWEQAHGIARLSGDYCRDFMRWRSLGFDEAVVWEKYVLQPGHPIFGEKTRDTDVDFESVSKTNQKLIGWGLAPQYALLNPGFKCPFPGSTTVTLDNPKYRLFNISLMKGKLVSFEYCMSINFEGIYRN